MVIKMVDIRFYCMHLRHHLNENIVRKQFSDRCLVALWLTINGDLKGHAEWCARDTARGA